MLTRVRNKLTKAAKIDQRALLQQIFRSTELQEDIIYYNTINQLFEKGEDKLGRTLESIGGGYHPYTVEIKLQKGQPVDRVTLKDTGQFYDSWKVVVPNGADYIMLVANPIKDGKDINEEWGGYVIGLNRDNMQKVIDYVREKLPQLVKQGYMAA